MHRMKLCHGVEQFGEIIDGHWADDIDILCGQAAAVNEGCPPARDDEFNAMFNQASGDAFKILHGRW